MYAPRRDDADYRRSLTGDATTRRSAFDALRKHYPYRRETDGLRVALNAPTPSLQQLISALGANLQMLEQ